MTLTTGFSALTELGELGRAATEVAIGTWSDPAVRASLAQQRLQALVRHARAHAPLHARLYRDLPADQVPRLADLPVMTKSALMADVTATLTDRSVTQNEVDGFLADTSRIGRLLHGRYAVWHSSGTSGEPAVFLHDLGALAVYQALETLRFRGLTSFADFGARLLAGERFALVMVTGGHFASISTVEHLRSTFPWMAASIAAFSLLTPLPKLVAQLNACAPTVLSTYPSAAEVLAREQEAGRLRLRLTELWTGGEYMAPCTRARLVQAFDCRVRNEYGASECLSIAWGCDHGALHVNDDWVLLEPVDAAGQPVAHGTPSHSVLLTNLANRVQPLIRYDLGDSITLLPPCSCGSSLPAIRVEGRHDETLRYVDNDGAAVDLLPLVLTTVMEEEAGVYGFQLRQTGRDTLTVSLDADSHGGAARVRRTLRAFLARAHLPHVAVRIDLAEPASSARSGKRQRVVRCLERTDAADHDAIGRGGAHV